MKTTRRQHLVGVAAMISALVALVGFAVPASSTPADGTAPAVKFGADEQKLMQAVVDEQLSKSVGGRQISINQIAYADGKMIMTFPLPGEQQARALDEPIVPLGTANCPANYVCLWSDTNFNGTRLGGQDGVGFHCGIFDLADWGFAYVASSVHNNQTTGTQSVLYNDSWEIEHANLAPSRISYLGVSAEDKARYWLTC